jgi:hypothetical protein
LRTPQLKEKFRNLIGSSNYLNWDQGIGGAIV